ncbi:TSUP family transporter [Patescibacteria group bacterium]
MTIYITLAFLFGFFIESIFGFAGPVISYAILGFFVDIKTLISLILYVGTVASICVLVTDKHSFSKKEYLTMVKLAIPGALIGALLLNFLSSEELLKILAVFLLGLAFHSFFEPKFKNSSKKLLLFLSGIIHGIFGLGGVVAIGTMKNSFAHKSQLRVTFATFFLTLNFIRAIQYFLQGTLKYAEIIKFWWIPAPLFLVIWLGHKVHLKISENIFKKGISVLLLIAGTFFLLN